VEGPILVATGLHAAPDVWSPMLQIFCNRRPYYQCYVRMEKWHTCAFLSKGPLNNVERNYDVHDKEMLGII